MKKNNNNNSESFSPGYCEYLVSAKASKKIVIARIAAIFAGIALIVALLGLMSKIPQVLFLWIVVVIAMEVIFFNKTKREFEYTIAQGTFTAEVIYGKSIRKKVAEFKISSASKVVAVSSNEYLEFFKDDVEAKSKKIYACDKKPKDMRLMYIPGEVNGATALFFDSCKKLDDCIKYYNRSAVVDKK